jgi:hypothetical protein
VHRLFRRLNPVSRVLLLDYRSGVAERLERTSGDDAGLRFSHHNSSIFTDGTQKFSITMDIHPSQLLTTGVKDNKCGGGLAQLEKCWLTVKIVSESRDRDERLP